MGFTAVPDRAAGYALAETDWDVSIKDNFNTGTWVVLANSTLSGTTASIDFTSIPGTWAHLMIVSYLRGDSAASIVNVNVRLNNDSGANYDVQGLAGIAASESAAESFAQTSAVMTTCPDASAGENLFGPTRILIPHYANSANNKAMLSRYGFKYGITTGDLLVGCRAGFWRSSAAITRVTLFPASGSFVSGSRATIYGLA